MLLKAARGSWFPTALIALRRSPSLFHFAFATQLAQSFTLASPRSARYLLISSGALGLPQIAPSDPS